MIIIIQEYGFSIDNFNTPEISKGVPAIGVLLVQLLLLEPGTIQSHPEMGVGLISRYRYSFEGRAPELESEFRAQIQKYLPNLMGVNISVREANRMYYITAQVDQYIYGITIDSDMNLKTTMKALNEIRG